MPQAPGNRLGLGKPEAGAVLVLLNTFYGPMQAIQPPEAIALFSSDSLRRGITVWGAYRNDGLWQNGLKKQVGKFFTQDERFGHSIACSPEEVAEINRPPIWWNLLGEEGEGQGAKAEEA